MAGSSPGHPVPIVAGKIDSARGPGTRELWWLDLIAEPHVAFPFLLAFAVVIFIVGLGGYPIYTRGEPREAIRIVDIVGGGGIILPTQAGLGLPWKPPLMYWLGALISVLAGRVNEWTVRLPSAMLAVAGIVVLLLLCRPAIRPANRPRRRADPRHKFRVPASGFGRSCGHDADLLYGGGLLRVPADR